MNKKWVIPVALALVVILFLVEIVLYAGRDIPEPVVADLALVRPVVAPEENAFTYFEEAAGVFTWTTNYDLFVDYLNDKPADTGAIAVVIAANGKALDLIRKGLDCPRGLPPEVADFNTEMPCLRYWRNTGKLLAAKVQRDRLEGRYADAAGDCVSLLQFGDIIMREPECMIVFLVGIAIRDYGLAQVRALALDSNTPPAELRRLALALDGMSTAGTGLVHAVKSEYRLAARLIDTFRKGGTFSELSEMGFNIAWLKDWPVPAYLFQRNKTKSLIADLTRSQIRNAAVPFNARTPCEREWETPLSAAGGIKVMLQPNVVGKVLCHLIGPGSMLLDRTGRTECNRAAARIMVAIALYRRDKGAMPDELNALIPDYLEAVPRDPFDGAPFRYKPSKGMIYSVNADGVDSGGSTFAPDAGPDETPGNLRWMAEDAVYDVGR